MVLGASAVWQVQKMTQQEHTAFVEKCNLQTVPAMYRLPDSSTVYLGPGSTLHYPAHFKGNTRELELKGEGFFEVTPDRDKPFILHTGAIQTRVLGTSFKVEAVDGQPLVVSVATGKVSVSTPTKELALLTPGRKITWYDTSKQAIAGQANIQVLEQWKTGEMVFEEQTMEQIARELQKRYRVLFVFINKGIADKTFSGTFSSAKPIDKILKTLSIAGRFHYERTGNRVINIYKTE
jgi:ferric-dicitrate binding protein FerR (iron transport regulator)